MRQWEMLYERTPLHTDAMLLVLALALHVPLGLIHMDAPAKRHAAGKTFKVDIVDIEKVVKKRQEKPAALPPKPPKIARALAQKVANIPKMIPRPAPPPPPPPKPREITLKTPEISQIKTPNLADKLAAQNKALQSKENFNKNIKLAAPEAKSLKIGGTASSSISAGSRLNSLAPGGGPAISGKSGFKVKENSLASIGGGENDIKIGGASQIVVVPTGRRSAADASVLSPVIGKSSFKGGAGASALSGSSNNAPAIALGGKSGSSIAVGGGRAVSAAPAGAAITGKGSFKASATAASSMGTGLSASPGSVSMPALPKKTSSKRPMFLITGPLQNRPLVSRPLPEYPAWAAEKGIEASVAVQVTVSPDGSVKNNMIVLRTSGYVQLDELAKSALRKWVFAALPEDQYRDETGSITITFSLH